MLDPQKTLHTSPGVFVITAPHCIVNGIIHSQLDVYVADIFGNA